MVARSKTITSGSKDRFLKMKLTGRPARIDGPEDAYYSHRIGMKTGEIG